MGDRTSQELTYYGDNQTARGYLAMPDVDDLEESLRRAGRLVTFYHYSGTGHWFFEPDRSQAYNQAAASLAWDRTLAFLRRPSTV